MRKFWIFTAASAILLALAASSQAQQISGDYVETRSADVYTGYCFANSEAGLTGNEAILGWRVRKGEWDGVNLEGLSVVGVVRANATLGDPFGNPFPAKAVLIVDNRASEAQRAALVSLAQCMSDGLLDRVVSVEVAPISFEMEGGHSGRASLAAGNFAGVETRAISDKDHVCGNEAVYYQPLVQMDHAMPAVAELDRYSGPGLGESWRLSGKRSAFVGSFSH
jgi:hypothetical protein